MPRHQRTKSNDPFITDEKGFIDPEQEKQMLLALTKVCSALDSVTRILAGKKEPIAQSENEDGK